MTDLIKQVLDEYNWKYAEGGGTIRVEVDGENASWSSFIRPEGEDSFSYYAVLPVRVEPDSTDSVMRLLHGINYSVRVGSFEMAPPEEQSGSQIMLKTYGLLTEGLISGDPAEAKEIVRRVIAYNMLTMDFYAKYIIKAACGGQVELGEILNSGNGNENEMGEEI